MHLRSRVWETQRTILRYEGAVNVVDVLRALTAVRRGMQDHKGASMYDEGDLPPEGTVETVREIREDLGEELSDEGDVVESLRSGAVMGQSRCLGNDLGYSRVLFWDYHQHSTIIHHWEGPQSE